MAGDIGFTVSPKELERLAARLRKAGNGREAQRRYQKAVASAARPIVPQVAAAARNARVTSTRGGQGRPKGGTRGRRGQLPLRARVANALDQRPTRTGVRIFVEAERVDPKYGASLPRYLDGELQGWRRWRHPVFGQSDRWTRQTGSPWFFRTIRRHDKRVEQAVVKAMDAVARDITS